MEQSLQKLNQHDRLMLWTERVTACRSSGKSVRQWCQENGVAEKRTTIGSAVYTS